MRQTDSITIDNQTNATCGQLVIRNGYSLLELMIALVLMVLVIGVVWSMMHQLVKLDEKGQQQSIRATAVRTLYRQLQSDLAHRLHIDQAEETTQLPMELATVGQRPNRIESFSSGHSESYPSNQLDVAENNRSATGMFRGDTFGFELIVVHSPKLAEQFEHYLEAQTTQRIQYGEVSSNFAQPNVEEFESPIPSTSSPPIPTQSASSPSSIRRIEYRFKPAVDKESAGTLNRSIYAINESEAEQSSPENQQLTVADLYRSSEQSDQQEGLSSGHRLIATDDMPAIASANFRYHDGEQWLDQWNDRHDGGYPRAIEIVFELASNQQIRDQQAADPPSEDQDNDIEQLNSIENWDALDQAAIPTEEISSRSGSLKEDDESYLMDETISNPLPPLRLIVMLETRSNDKGTGRDGGQFESLAGVSSMGDSP